MQPALGVLWAWSGAVAVCGCAGRCGLARSRFAAVWVGATRYGQPLPSCWQAWSDTVAVCGGVGRRGPVWPALAVRSARVVRRSRGLPFSGRRRPVQLRLAVVSPDAVWCNSRGRSGVGTIRRKGCRCGAGDLRDRSQAGLGSQGIRAGSAWLGAAGCGGIAETQVCGSAGTFMERCAVGLHRDCPVRRLAAVCGCGHENDDQRCSN